MASASPLKPSTAQDTAPQQPVAATQKREDSKDQAPVFKDFASI